MALVFDFTNHDLKANIRRNKKKQKNQKIFFFLSLKVFINHNNVVSIR